MHKIGYKLCTSAEWKKDDDYPGNFDLFLLPTLEVIVTCVDRAIFKRSNGNMFL